MSEVDASSCRCACLDCRESRHDRCQTASGCGPAGARGKPQSQRCREAIATGSAYRCGECIACIQEGPPTAYDRFRKPGYAAPPQREPFGFAFPPNSGAHRIAGSPYESHLQRGARVIRAAIDERERADAPRVGELRAVELTDGQIRDVLADADGQAAALLQASERRRGCPCTADEIREQATRLHACADALARFAEARAKTEAGPAFTIEDLLEEGAAKSGE